MYRIVNLVNAMLKAKRDGDVVTAKILEDRIAELQYIW